MAQEATAVDEPIDLIRWRKAAVKTLPTAIGVYALCDLDAKPIYVGQSIDSMRGRISRHLTSARSDIIGNRMIDIWEVAFVLCWAVPQQHIAVLESHLFHEFDALSSLMNGFVPARYVPDFAIPEPTRAQMLPDSEIATRRRTELRLTRQAKHFGDLLDYFLVVKDAPHVLRSLCAHFQRLTRYFESLRGDPDAEAADAEE
ncbi:MAG: GIY-YIG nuclease family protein [Planctomycetota bacterium]